MQTRQKMRVIHNIHAWLVCTVAKLQTTAASTILGNIQPQKKTKLGESHIIKAVHATLTESIIHNLHTMQTYINAGVQYILQYLYTHNSSALNSEVIMKLLTVSCFLAILVALTKSKQCAHCIIENCGPCANHCEAEQLSSECESCVSSCVKCISVCKASSTVFYLPNVCAICSLF